eukprot:Gregarina_sp_Pseudo_9__2422@NODE_2716_length_902_cov_5_630359_g2488_i0_p1_GENE_NODE_2716_length_902_cov_5_630359_g2488_i0NODE_2716_length_902_cov_5_630359_g2488_i0_p1_ORF_typecomplete_len158_score5_05_NODE_2716_length_902_cov_5_630359_g2488_i0368841
MSSLNVCVGSVPYHGMRLQGFEIADSLSAMMKNCSWFPPEMKTNGAVAPTLEAFLEQLTALERVAFLQLLVCRCTSVLRNLPRCLNPSLQPFRIFVFGFVLARTTSATNSFTSRLSSFASRLSSFVVLYSSRSFRFFGGFQHSTRRQVNLHSKQTYK